MSDDYEVILPPKKMAEALAGKIVTTDDGKHSVAWVPAIDSLVVFGRRKLTYRLVEISDPSEWKVRT